MMFRGVTSGRELRAGTVIVDIGGGSTELVAAEPDGVRWHESLDIGSVRLTESFLHGEPPTTAELDACAPAGQGPPAARVPAQIPQAPPSAIRAARTGTHPAGP